jgi:hypothetical protein
MEVEDILYEAISLNLKDELFTEIKRLEMEDPYKYKDYTFLTKTAFDNVKQKKDESI